MSTIVLIMSISVSALGNMLFGQTRGGVLALLYGHSGQTFYLRQISREIGASAGAVQRELETLSKIGLIERPIARSTGANCAKTSSSVISPTTIKSTSLLAFSSCRAIDP